MDDELEDKVFYQTYISHMKLLSKFAMGLSPLNSTMAYIWKLLRLYFMRPEVVLFTMVCVVIVIYLHMLDIWSQNVLNRFGSPIAYWRQAGRRYAISGTGTLRSAAERQSWEETYESSAVYAVQGRRPRMEDRYVINEDVNETGIAFFAIFDGHGGEYAAVFAKDVLVDNLINKMTEASNIAKGKVSSPSPTRANCSDESKDASPTDDTAASKELTPDAIVQRRTSFKKSLSTTDGTNVGVNSLQRESDNFLKKLNSIRQTKESLLQKASGNNAKPQQYEARCYIEKDGNITFGKMISDEILAADYKLIEMAKKETNVAGTTALLAVLDGTRLIVANVGDSRGVMCDGKGNAIPLSFDHKPQQTRELKRIQEAGGFIAFKGVWRVAGILATSRAMGDYPLKEKNFVIAEPDVLTFELNDHKPKFLILASDGLWDTFANEEAVMYIKDRLHEPHFGAKSITLESYRRGSVDNITVLIIVFRNGRYQIGESS